mmetsp:Transcript_22850/g.29266  ORF Transcript_22850/g.29266 Transcript_22850/m.29266 type:complete len:103 (+) Transcript_22850:473-781(+)
MEFSIKRESKRFEGVKEKQCSGVHERFETSRYCGMCYRKSKVTHPHLKSDVRKVIVQTKKNCGTGGVPLSDCLNCGERVCLACWPVMTFHSTNMDLRSHWPS